MGAETMSMESLWESEFFGVPVVREVFIETGTKSGDTAAVAASLFGTVHSVEIDAQAFVRCAERLAGTNVKLHLGDSRKVLPEIIDPGAATTFYLDAHCEGAPSVVPEADTECPLLGELDAILAVPWIVRPLILVDDIHMFKPAYWTDPTSNHALFTAADWPRFDEITGRLAAFHYAEDRENRIGIWA